MASVASFIFADMTIDGSSLIWWLVVGLVAGFLASVVMRGGGFGIVGDIIAGIVGAFIGGWLFGLLGISAGGGIVGSIIVAFVGSCILIAILCFFSGSYRGRAR